MELIIYSTISLFIKKLRCIIFYIYGYNYCILVIAVKLKKMITLSRLVLIKKC